MRKRFYKIYMVSESQKDAYESQIKNLLNSWGLRQYNFEVAYMNRNLGIIVPQRHWWRLEANGYTTKDSHYDELPIEDGELEHTPQSRCIEI